MFDLASLGGALAAGIVILGAGFGIGKLASAALEGTARQPEAAGNLRLTMIIAAALVEGLGFFALVQCGNAIKNSSSVLEVSKYQDAKEAAEAAKGHAPAH